MKVLVASNNRGKLVELNRLFNLPELELVLPGEIGLKDFDVEETGKTYYENAALKAIAYAEKSGLPALADDSGLEVEALNGEPGIYTKRFAGENATDADRIVYLLNKLANAESSTRAARFVAELVLAAPDGKILIHARGTCEGVIGAEPRGQKGFGYDPIFLPAGHNGRTMAELTEQEKDAISHRGNAARLIAPYLKEHLF